MTETNNRSIPAINAVEGFNPAEFTRELSNEDGTMSLYLDVKYRLLWFRLHRPEGKIDSEIIRVDDKSAVVSCRLYNDKNDPAEQYIARACAQRFMSSERFGDRYLEIAETAALGRALAAAGYGTQFCGSSDMLGDVIADAPIELPPEDDDLPASASRVVHQMAQPEPATPVLQAPVREPEIKPVRKRGEAASVEELLNTMTLEDAKNVVVDVGRYAGVTLGEIAIRKPGDLDWYVNFYSGRNNALKAGAILLVRAASQKAS